MSNFEIAGRPVGPEHEPLVIAEIGINHNGSLDEAINLVDAAIEGGAEVIKHQTHVIDDEMTLHAKDTIPGNADSSIYDIMSSCALNEKDEYELMRYVQSKGSIFMSSPFSRAAAERLEKFDVPAYKIGSGECNNYPLIAHIASKGKPIILSTGMNSLERITKAVQVMREYKVPFALLHCTSIYPTPPEKVRLGAMLELQRNFPDALIGLSDHSTTNYPCLGAVALGASILERHFIDDKSKPGPDVCCSMDANELRELITGSNIIAKCLGGRKEELPEERVTQEFAFSSVVTIKDIAEGEVLSMDNIWVKRPGTGDYSAEDFEGLIGKVAKQSIKSGEQLKKVEVE